MKYCLSSRQSSSYLAKADEIRVEYRDRESIIDLIEKYPNKRYILDCYDVEEMDWPAIEKYNILTKNNLVLCVPTADMIRTANALGIKSYYGFAIENFWELNAFINLGVEYIRLGMGLFFQMDRVKMAKGDVKVRAVPNLAYNDNLPHKDGVCGQWIRPEDLCTIYEPYIDVVEFEDCDRDKEQALYRIYAEQHEWESDLQAIITNLNYPGVNRMILDEVSKTRLNCNQKCQYGGCHICQRNLDLANPERLRQYVEVVKLPIE